MFCTGPQSVFIFNFTGLPVQSATGGRMNVERATMDGCGQQPLFLTGTSGSGGISSPQQQTVQTGAPPEHYGGPLSLSICISDSGHEILRPKPRR